MSTQVTLVVIEPTGTRKVETVKCDLAYLQRAVGGYVEAVSSRDWTMFCNEEGKLRGLPLNAYATGLALGWGWQFLEGDHLVGTVVVVGDRGGDPADLPEHLLIDAACTCPAQGEEGHHLGCPLRPVCSVCGATAYWQQPEAVCDQHVTDNPEATVVPLVAGADSDPEPRPAELGHQMWCPELAPPSMKGACECRAGVS